MASLRNAKLMILWFFAFALGFFNACEKSEKDIIQPYVAPIEDVEELGFQRKLFVSDSLQMEASIGMVVLKGEADNRRFIFDNGVHILAKDHRSKKLMELKANTGIAIYPFEEISLGNIWLESNDGTEFEADKLEWNRKSVQIPVLLRGEVRIITPKLILEGDSLKADVLFAGFEMRKVTAVIDLE